MMEDQLDEYVEYLNNNGYSAYIENGDIKIDLTIEDKDIAIVCKLGEYFPYEIPSIFIDENSKQLLVGIPHRYTDGSICIFDKNVTIPNVCAPKELILETVSRAINVISDGLKGKNRQDFIDELFEYWRTKSELKAQAYITDMNKANFVQWQELDNRIIISDTNERLQEISHAINCEKKEDSHIGFIIPVDGEKLQIIPKTDSDILNVIENCSSCFSKYKTFMQKNIYHQTLIILNVVFAEGNVLIGWVHPAVGTPPGFREGHVDIKTVFKMIKVSGRAVSVENCAQNRLFNRGGDGREIKWNKVAVMGCGSVGSFVVDSLKYYGTGNFVLVDNENLNVENIGRHTSGYIGVDSAKVDMISFLLLKYNPNIVCETYSENAHEILEDKTDVLNSCDVIIVTVAYMPVEYHVCQLLLEGKITKPIILMWVEPYLIGGHAIFIKKKQNIYKDIFSEDTYEYKYPILKDVNKYLKREAGCQSSYMPYSGFLLQQFVSRVLDYILSDCWSCKGNYRITWCGKLSEARKNNMEINNEYKNLDDYSVVKHRID